MAEEPRRRSPYRQLAVYTGIIFILPSMLVGGFYVGYLVDEQFQTGPWAAIIGLCFGGVGAFYELFRLLNRD